jgi:hypothetical protein
MQKMAGNVFQAALKSNDDRKKETSAMWGHGWKTIKNKKEEAKH